MSSIGSMPKADWTVTEPRLKMPEFMRESVDEYHYENFKQIMSIKESLTDSDRNSKKGYVKVKPKLSVASNNSTVRPTSDASNNIPINFTSQIEVEDYLKKEEENKKYTKIRRARKF
jgi:hypothetical protein